MSIQIGEDDHLSLSRVVSLTLVGASDANDKSEIDRMITLGVDFFLTKSPFHYMSATSKKKSSKKMRAHAAVMFGG